MPPVLAEAALFDSLLHRYGMNHPDELRQRWSRALMLVMGEAITHAYHSPPQEGDEPGATARPANGAPMSAIGMGLIPVEQVGEDDGKRFRIAAVSGGLITYEEIESGGQPQ